MSASQQSTAATEARTEATPARREMVVHKSWEGDIYRGTKAELIEAGLAREGMFPGDSGMEGRKWGRYHADGTPMSKGERTKPGCFLIRIGDSRGRFELCVEVAPAVIEARRQAQQADSLQSAAVARALVKRQRDKLQAFPKTAKAFCDLAAESFWWSWAIYAVNFVDDAHESGYELPSHLQSWLDDAALGMYWAIKGAANDVSFDAEHRHEALRKAEVKSAQADGPLQALLLELKANSGQSSAGTGA